VFGVGLVDF